MPQLLAEAMADDTPGMNATSLSRLWGRAPTVRRSRVAGELALWRFNHDKVTTFSGIPDEETHTVCVMLDGFLHDDLRLDGRPGSKKYMTGDVFSLVHAGSAPLSYIPAAQGLLLHLYLPLKLLLDPAGRPIELREQCHGEDRRIGHYARRLRAEMLCDDAATGLALDAAILGMASSLARCWSTSGVTPAAWVTGAHCDRRLLRAMERLAANLDAPPRLAELAEAEGISQRHLLNLFQEGVGQSPHRWLTARRMDRARFLLETTDREITDIALECGFSSSQHFSATFRAHFGTTATAFRRRIAD
ncbi:AraC family transcriptional regulator [Blastomonas sp. UPD001]|uniref:helix-turn-helix domain-containing protein n=1 Tax=Blastomonas sp. UPD001 TaxID=2217673 RepID=UPI000E349FA9|nr:AraC family transcriptional regulator [Blastomonas sp. UPD001]